MLKKFFIICLSSSMFLSSCKDVLDAPTQSSLDESVIFTTPVLAEGALTAVLQCFMEQNSHRARYLSYYGTNTDVEVNNNIRTPDDRRARLSNYNTTTTNSDMNTTNNVWAMMYQGIERANIAIAAIRKYNNVATNREMSHLLGEFLTIRAVMYSELIKGWGDVPARFEPINSETINLPRSNRDIIYKQLLADLEEAAGYLPWPNESAKTRSVERVSKAFAKGLRARIALYAGGYSQRMDGTVRLSDDPELAPRNMYQIAKDECLSIIGQNVQTLNNSFEGIFKTLMDEKGEAGLESMWEIPFNSGRGRVIYEFGVRHDNADKYVAAGGQGGNVGPNPIMLYAYEKEDVRRDVTVVPYLWKDGKQTIGALNRLYLGKYRYEWMNRIVNGTDDGMNWLYMRYADIWLMAAEAINEVDGPGAAAPYLERIRQRAYPNNPEKVTAFMNDNSITFFDKIVNERALEFCGEMLRKADLIRWNKLSEKLNEAKLKLKDLELVQETTGSVTTSKRHGIYSTLPEKVYYKTLNDGETIEIYGLNFGDTDAYGVANYPASANWKLVGESDTRPYWDVLFLRDPNLQQYWPIWQTFIDNSNGILNNGGVSYE